MPRLSHDFRLSFRHPLGNGGVLTDQRELCVQAVVRKIDQFRCDVCEFLISITTVIAQNFSHQWPGFLFIGSEVRSNIRP